jgi:hypothetical protein
VASSLCMSQCSSSGGKMQAGSYLGVRVIVLQRAEDDKLAPFSRDERPKDERNPAG